MAMYETEVPYAVDTDPRAKTTWKRYRCVSRTVAGRYDKAVERRGLVWDEFKQECFMLRAMIFVAITDYPGGFSLSGQMKGKKGYLVCLGDTQYVYLFGSKKLVYMRSQWFLPSSHRYREMRKEFDGTEEKDRAPKHLDGKLVFELVIEAPSSY